MALRNWILKKERIATATVATPATVLPGYESDVAKVAGVAVAEHQKQKIRLLSGDRSEEGQDTPAICRGCAQSETIHIEGKPAMHGCVRRLDVGPWAEEWRRLPADMQRCIVH